MLIVMIFSRPLSIAGWIVKVKRCRSGWSHAGLDGVMQVPGWLDAGLDVLMQVLGWCDAGRKYVYFRDRNTVGKSRSTFGENQCYRLHVWSNI